MKVNFETILTTLDNEPIQIPPEGQSTCQLCGHIKEPEDLTLEKVAIVSLFNVKQDESADNKLKRYILAQRIKQHPIVELSSEDITFIRKEVANAYGPLVYGRVSEILDPTEVEKLAPSIEASKE